MFVKDLIIKIKKALSFVHIAHYCENTQMIILSKQNDVEQLFDLRLQHCFPRFCLCQWTELMMDLITDELRCPPHLSVIDMLMQMWIRCIVMSAPCMVHVANHAELHYSFCTTQSGAFCLLEGCFPFEKLNPQTSDGNPKRYLSNGFSHPPLLSSSWCAERTRHSSFSFKQFKLIKWMRH